MYTQHKQTNEHSYNMYHNMWGIQTALSAYLHVTNMVGRKSIQPVKSSPLKQAPKIYLAKYVE